MSTSRGGSEDYLRRLSNVLAGLDRPAIDEAVARIAAAWKRNAQIIAFGNGGSAMTALHYMTDWTKMVFLATGRAFFGRTLLDNVGAVTAWGNDFCFEDIFVGQLRNCLRGGDLVIAVSGSGNSENVIRAVDYANENGGETIGLCGFDGGRLRQRAQHCVWVQSYDMQLCEDAHAIFGHIVMKALCGSVHGSALAE